MHLILVTLLLLLFATQPAHAELIAVALAAAVLGEGVLVAGTTAAALAGAALGIAASVGISLIASALRSSTDPTSTDTVTSASGNDLSADYGGDVPRSAIFGLAPTAGHLVYANVYGPANNSVLQAVFVLGDGQHDGINRLWYNGKPVTLPSGGPAHGVAVEIPESARPSDGGICTHIKFFDGRFDQLADPELIDNANPAGRWTAAHKGRGVSYLVVTQLYNEELELTGMPTLIVEMRGLKLYDPRFDDTAGGSGPQRWNDPSTYAWSDNPAIIEYNYRRGIYIDDQLIIGMGVSAADLILPMYVAAANVCDELVALKDGGTEKRYRCGFTASSDNPHSEAITTVRDAMAGYSLERAGQFAPIPGVNQLTSFLFTDDDLEVGKPFAFSKYKTRSSIATAIYGSFSDPEQLWGTVPFPPRIDPADDALMGERLSRNVDLTQVFSSSQAQRIAEIERRRGMLQTNGACTLPAKFFGIQPGDWGTYQSERYGTFNVVVKGATINEDHSITLTWDRIEAHVFSWTTAGEEDRPAIPIGAVPGPRVNLVTGFAAVGIDVPGDGGVMHAGFALTWDAITDPTVDSVIIEFRVAATGGDWESVLFTEPSQGFGQLSRGIQGNTVYELRAKLLVSPFRVTGIAGPVSALSGAHIVQTAVSSGAADSVLAANVIGQLVATQIADAAITASKLHDQAVTATAFAAGIEPVGLVATLPNPVGYTGLKTVYNTTNHTLYTYNAGSVSWEAPSGVSDFSELTGQAVSSQIADAAITAAKIHDQAVTATAFAAGIEPVGLVASNPTPAGYTGPKTIFNTTDKKLYRYNAAIPAWTASTAAGDITGQLTDAQIADLAAAKLTGQIIGTQISDSAITTPKIFAGAVTTAALAAGAVTTAKLAVGTGSNKIANSDGQGGGTFHHALSWSTAATPTEDIYSGIKNVGAAHVMFTGLAGQVAQVVLYAQDAAGNNTLHPVVAGQTYEFSAYTATINANAQAYIVWVDNANAVISSVNSAFVTGGGGNDLSAWKRPFVIGTAPAGATQAYCLIHSPLIADGNGALYMACPYFAPANPNQTEASPYVPAGATIISGGQIITDSVTALQIAGHTITAAEIASGTITAGEIAAGAITTTQLAAGAVTTTILAAGAVTTAKLAVGVSSNKIWNSDGLGGVLFDNQPTGSVPGLTAGTWPYIPGITALLLQAPAGAVDQFALAIITNPSTAGGHALIPVVAGQFYEFSFYAATTNCAAAAYIRWWDNTGAAIVQVGGAQLGPGGAGTNLAGWLRPFLIAQAPPGAVNADVFVFFPVTTAGPLSALAACPYFAPASANQTEASPYVPSGATVVSGGQIVTDSITALQIAANAITATELSAGAVTAGKVAAGAVTAGTIAAGAVSTTELAAGAVTAGILAAGAVTTDKLAVGNSANKLLNSDGQAGVFQNALAQSNVTSLALAFQTFLMPTMGVTYMGGNATAAAGSSAVQLIFQNPDINGANTNVPIVAGQAYECSYYVAIGSVAAYAGIAWYDAAGAFISMVLGGAITSSGGGAVIANWARPGVFGVAPSNAVSAGPLAYFTNLAPGPISAYIAAPYFGAANPNQSQLSPWSPSGVTLISGGQLTTNSITAGKIQANAIQAGHIAAGAINATNIIADNIIVAGKSIADNLTIFRATSTTISLPAGNNQVLSLTFPSSGYPVAITCTCTAESNIGDNQTSPANIDMNFALLLDGAQYDTLKVPGLLRSQGMSGALYYNCRLFGSYSRTDRRQPGAGNHTLAIWCNPGTFGAGANVTLSITTIEALRSQ